ncbi:MAG: helix-turn-helix domain-containing protein [Prevotella sp.]|nr:helix-turn-helix domain-containing protein [Prevotella sp.]
MDGKALKQKLKQTGISFAEIARKLNVNPQSLTSIFNGIDVKSGTIEKLSAILKIPIRYFYEDYDGDMITPIDLTQAEKANPNIAGTVTPERVKILTKEIEFLKKTIEQNEILLREKDRVIGLYNLMLKERLGSSSDISKI